MKIKRNRLFPLMTAGVMTISQLMPAMTVLAADTEIVKQDDGSKVYYKNGEAQKDYTGLVNADDAWFYVEKGVVVEDKVGYVDYEGSKFLVVNGKLADKVNGLSQDPEHTDDWYFCSNGQVQTQYTGLALYDGEWFYINKGKLDTKLAAYVEYDGGLFYVAAGRILKEVSGLAQDPNGPDWYFLAEGQAQTQYTGLAFYDGEWFYVINGKLAEDYTGSVEYDGATFDVVNGMVAKNGDVVVPTPAPEVTPEVTPEATPEATPQVTPESTPETTPTTTPEATPEVTPESTPETTPTVTPEATPEVTPEVTPETTPTTTPETTPTATPAPIGDDELATIYVDNITDHDACIHIKLNGEMIQKKHYDMMDIEIIECEPDVFPALKAAGISAGVWAYSGGGPLGGSYEFSYTLSEDFGLEYCRPVLKPGTTYAVSVNLNQWPVNKDNKEDLDAVFFTTTGITPTTPVTFYTDRILVDGIYYHSYYGLEVTDEGADFLEKLIAKCEAGDLDDAAGMLRIAPIITEAESYPDDYGWRYIGYKTESQKYYKIALTQGVVYDENNIPTIYNGSIYLIPINDDKGFYLRYSPAENVADSSYYYAVCECSNGMFNGEFEYHVLGRNVCNAVGTIKNGLLEGDYKAYNVPVHLENGDDRVNIVGFYKDGNLQPLWDDGDNYVYLATDAGTALSIRNVPSVLFWAQEMNTTENLKTYLLY